MDFAIFSKAGLDESVPSILLQDAFLSEDSEGVHQRFGEYRTMRGRLAYLTDADNVKIACPTDVFAITDITNKTITVTGDVTSGNTPITDGDTIRINGNSTAAANKTYTVSGTPSYSSPSSTIVVTEAPSGSNDGNVFAGATPIIKYHRHVKQATGTEYLLLGTAYHILLWVPSSYSLSVKFTCTTPGNVTNWEIITHIDNVYATNDDDLVLIWDVQSDPGNDFEGLDDSTNGLDLDGGSTYLTKAKYIVSFEGYLIVGYTTEGAGANNVKAQRIRWSSQNDPTDWDATGSGDTNYKDFTNTPDFLTGFGRYANFLIIAKEKRMHRGWLTTEDTVFEWVEELIKVGCLASHSLVNDKAGRLYWLGNDLSVRELNSPLPIHTRFEKTMRNLNTSKTGYAQARYIEEFGEIWFALTVGSSDTNNRIISYNPDTGESYQYYLPIRAFGEFTQQTVYTYDTLPYDTYEEWGLEWLIYDTSVNVVGFPLDLGSDYSGYTYRLHGSDNDAGSSYERNMIFTTTLAAEKAGLNQYKRVNDGIDFYFNRESSGSVTIEYKEDKESSWQSLDSVSLVDSDEPDIVVVHVPCDLRARVFDFQLRSSDYFEFLGMAFNDVVLDGER